MKNYFWDSNVFICFLNNEPNFDLDSIGLFLDDAERGDCLIHTSTLAFSEATPGKLGPSAVGDLQAFFDDMQSAVVPYSPTPETCKLAGLLKDIGYKKNGSKNLVLTMGDAIMLASAIELQEVFEVKIDAFHAFDNGGGRRTAENDKQDGGRAIPLLSYHEWLEGVTDPIAQKASLLNRCIPVHPSPRLIND